MQASRTAEIDPVVAQTRSQFKPRGPRLVDESVIPASALLASPKQKPGPLAQETSTEPRRHVVLAGESFESIARTFYGSKHHASLLWWANRGTVAWPEALKAGTTIIIPPLEQIAAARLAASPRRSRPAPEPHFDSSCAPSPISASRSGRCGQSDAAFFRRSPGGTRGPPGAAGLAASAGKEVKESQSAPPEQSDDSVKGGGYAVHIVRRQETLQSIAGDRLGDVRRSAEIADLNRDLLRKEGRLTPGQRLLLPGDAGPPPPVP